MQNLVLFQIALSFVLVIAVWLPFVRSDYWIFRILEYPRFQKFILCLLVSVSWLFTVGDKAIEITSSILLGISSIYLFYKILPYTVFSRKEMKTVNENKSGASLKLFAANVYMDNNNFSKMLQQIKRCDPDLIFLVETDQKWQTAMDVLLKEYPYALQQPQDDTYGMLLYSRFVFKQAEIKHIVEPHLPSADVVFTLPTGTDIQLWGLHPKPPVPGEDERSTAKDKELMIVAEMAAKSKLPVIVAGDLNDVAWSYTTKLFRKTSRLIDPRRGRGFYSTFSAKNPILRFPLDYVFCSNDFGLIKMKRLPKNGSDHFAMFIHLQYDTELKQLQQKPEKNSKTTRDANDKKNAAA